MAGPARRWTAVLGVGALGLLPACGATGQAADVTVESTRPATAVGAADLAALPAACRVMTRALVEQALGVKGVVGPIVVEDGCGWNQSAPSCQMVSLGIDVQEGPSAATSYAAAEAVAVAPQAVAGLGQQAFMTTDLGIMDSSLPMTFVNVLDRGHWLRFTLLGRAGKGGEALLLGVAHQVVGATSN